VAVNHRIAPLLYVSPSLINVQADTGPGIGTVAVQVISNCSVASEAVSGPQTLSARPVAPEFFFYKLNPNGVNPVAATDAVSGAR
jgi:uncharacterized protein (TIGR03437 family)